MNFPTISKLLGTACLLANGLLGFSAMAQQQQEAFKEIQIAQDKFSRGVPPPAWVNVEKVIPETQSTASTVFRLADTQYMAGDAQTNKQTVYVRRVIKVNDTAGLQQLAQYGLGFQSLYQQMQLNKLSIWRNNVEIDKTLTASIRFLQRETGLEQGVYNGEVTASILIDDLRVGDSLDIAYTETGSNPVMGNKFVGSASIDQSIPTELRKVALSHAVDRKIQWRLMGDLSKISPQYSESTQNGMKKMLWEEKSIVPVPFEAYVPIWFIHARFLQFSEYQDWKEIAAWGTQLFQSTQSLPLPDEAQALITRIRVLPTQQEQVSEVLKWVQSEIRYFSVSLGESSHRPHAPSETLKSRYGDCKDKTLLMVEILRGLGISAQAVLLNAQTRLGTSKYLPSPYVFDHAIVHVKLGDKTYFLDPTRQGQSGRLDRMGQSYENVEVLVVAADTTGLTTIKTPNISELLVDMLSEKVVVNKFGEDAVLTTSHTVSGLAAEYRRLTFARVPNKELIDKALMENYEARYPGIKQVGPLVIEDDPVQNIFRVDAKYTGPKIAITAGTDWGVRYGVSSLQGIIYAAPSPTRLQPIAVPAFPRKVNYRLDVEFPEDVSVSRDPITRVAKNRAFDYMQNVSFRGNKASSSIQMEILEPMVDAKQTPAYMDALRKLDEVSHRVFVVAKNDIKASGFLGLGKKSLQQTLVDRMNETIMKVSKTITDGGVTGDDLADAYCSRANALNDLGKLTESLKDAELAVKTAPNFATAYMCRGDTLYSTGEFTKAISDYSKAITLTGTDKPPYSARGRAKFYAGQLAAAHEDFTKAVSLEKENSENSLYSELWRVWTQKRLGLTADEKQLKFAAAEPRGAWPRPALAMLHGIISVDEALQTLETKTGDDKVMAQAEGFFYVGQLYQTQNNKEKAIEYYKKTRELGIIHYSEHISAGLELKQLGINP
jgi:transglutaminase-like putative cysteine protease/tetratricopeptide (TPR) repeat protein